jgi:hypothetical protein
MLLAVSMILLSRCDREVNHFISDAAYRARVESALESKRLLFADSSLFRVFSDSLSVVEHEALSFLYAYMPLGDVSDYSGEFYLRNVRSSLAVRREMPWGSRIPEEIFRHFVLPVRINNENLDSSRWIFYDELRDRVKDLSLYDAVLEVNHWCHEVSRCVTDVGIKRAVLLGTVRLSPDNPYLCVSKNDKKEE